MKSRRNYLVLPAIIVIVGGVLLRANGQTPLAATANVTLWDTGTPFGETVDMENRAAWKAVPSDLLTLEANPSRAFSDPGYYGREYEFQGDAVVENGYLIAVVRSAKGAVAFYSKADPSRKVAEFVPVQTKGRPTTIPRRTILQNTGDDVALEISFATSGAGAGLSTILAFGKTPIVEIKPAQTMPGISLLSPIEYGVAPDFIGDDLVLAPSQYPSDNTLYVPCENLFLGLLKGQDSVLVVTWPKGKQQMTLGLSEQGQEVRRIESIALDNDRQSVYLALLEAPGIWHREILGAPYLEKVVASQWQRPFPAKWVTQLYEGQVKATYAFRDAPADIWRGGAGRYNYPVWFRGDNAFYHLSKKVLPKGESVVYFLEGQGTPGSLWTPVDILKATLGRPACDSILDLPGRTLRTHHRRGAAGIRRACTCGGTDAIEAIFKAGREVEKRQDVEAAVEDMVYFVTRHMERIDEYRAFADDMLTFLRATASSRPELKAYLDDLVQIVQRIPDEYGVQQENIKSLEYTGALAARTIALTRKKDPKNLPACLELGKAWRAMGGAQDGVLAEYHIHVRRLFQEAGSRCVNQPKAVEPAREIRNRARQCLRHPDGYEIWPNY